MNNEQFDKAAREVTDYFAFNNAYHPARQSADDLIKHAEGLARDKGELLRFCINSLAMLDDAATQCERQGIETSPTFNAWHADALETLRSACAEALAEVRP